MDEEPGFFRQARVAILGLGLIGGSLALALKGKCARIWGCDPDAETRHLAIEQGIVDRVAEHPAEILQKADLIVLAAPVLSILDLLEGLPEWTDHPAVVFDLGSTKTEILNKMSLLPRRFDPIGGHPMAGKEKNGLAHADSELFVDAPFALIPLERTTGRARQMAVELVAAVGARPVWLEAQEHDAWTAATSHLPYLIACALAMATPEEAAAMAGPSLRGATRVAASSPRMMLDILRTNRQNVLSSLTLFRKQLDTFEALLRAEDWDQLEGMLVRSAEAHARLVKDA